MAFTGSPVVKKVTDNCWRITGVSLAGDATGTIGFADKTVPSNISIGKSPDWQPYELDDQVVGLRDVIEVEINVTTDVDETIPISVTKIGTTHGDFEIALHNDGASEDLSTGVLEIYVTWAGH